MFGPIDSKGALPKFESIPVDLSTPPLDRTQSGPRATRSDPRGPKSVSRRTRIEPRAAKSSQERPKTGPRATKSGPRPPRAAQERSEGHLGGILARLGTCLEGKFLVFRYVFQYFLNNHVFNNRYAFRPS